MSTRAPSDREQVVRSLMEGGLYASEEEMVDAALKLLLERDEQARLEQLSREVAIGLDQADRGELAPFDPKATLERVRSRRPGQGPS